MDAIISNNNLLGNFSDFREKMNKHNFIFSYRGNMPHSVVKSLLSMTEKKIDSLNEDISVKKKIFGVMISCLQTICSPAKIESTNKESLFMINKIQNDGYSIYTGIYIDKENSDSLKNVLDQINELSLESLSDLRKEKLMDIKKIEDAFNLDEATLGLINIAKKSGRKINYHIENSDNNLSFFSLEILIN